MKRLTSIRLVAALMATALTSACASTPVTSYRLATEAGPVQQVAPLTISVRRVSIPSYLDQGNVPEPVNRFVVGSFPDAIWSGPFSDTLQSTMVDDLAQRLNGATVLDSNGSIEAPSDMQIEINVLRFDPTVDGNVQLTMQVALKEGANHRLVRVWTISHTLATGGDTASDIVGAMSALWASAADEIAASVATAH